MYMLISLIITAAIVLIWIILAYISERFEIPSAFWDGIIAFIGMAIICIFCWIFIKWEIFDPIDSCCGEIQKIGAIG